MQRRSRVRVAGGDIAVTDHGGAGRDVLLVHTVGANQNMLAEFAPVLARDTHVVSMDLRGHGQSSAELESLEDFVDDFPRVVAALGLVKPVIVGHQYGGGVVTAAAAAAPELPGAICVIDSPAVLPQAVYRDILDMVANDSVLDELTLRFGLGRRGRSAASMERFIQGSSRRLALDWLSFPTTPARARRYVEAGIVVSADGSWVRRPTREAMRFVTDLPEGFPLTPGRELFVDQPFAVWAIQPTEGEYARGFESFAAAAADEPGWEARWIEGSPYVPQAAPRVLAAVLVELLGTLPSAQAPSARSGSTPRRLGY